MVNQLALSVRLKDEATFANFYDAKNQELISNLKKLPTVLDQKFIYVWGNSGVGRSHLLQASCHWFSQQNFSTILIPLKNFSEISPQILEGIENSFLVCIDDIDQIVGQRDWEEALFHFYNRSYHRQLKLVISGSTVPKELAFLLPDLCSRLSNAVIYQIKPLNDEEKLLALQMRASSRGLSLSEEVGKYLLHHHSRNMTALFDTLELLDQASLEAQHRLTVPFLKSVLEE